MSDYRRKLIEVALPLEAINEEGARRKRKAPKGFPTKIHPWWAQRPIAACSAVLFGQLVDDPSAWPDQFPSEEAQENERQRLFTIIAELVKWENVNDETILGAARIEIARSLARRRLADGHATSRDTEVLQPEVDAQTVREYLAEVAPVVHDPFAGGGSIPLEAHRLGLRVVATDLNPVAVMINKALVEIPPKFSGRAPVGPEDGDRKQSKFAPKEWRGAAGLADDIRRYGSAIANEAKARLKDLYPEIELPKQYGGGKVTVVAWLWARTVESPNPAFRGVHVPLVKSFVVSSKKGSRVWVEPVFSADRKSFAFEIRTGDGKPAIESTVSRKGGVCLASGEPIPFSYIRREGRAGRMGCRLLAIVAEHGRRRVYLPPSDVSELVGLEPADAPEAELPNNPRNFNTPNYGLRAFGDLFTNRQLTALNTFRDLILRVRETVIEDAMAAGWCDDGKGLEDGGIGATAYGDALATYLSFGLSRLADYNSSLATWRSKDNAMRSAIPNQAIPMVWDFAEANPFGKSSASFEQCVNVVRSVLPFLPNETSANPGRSELLDASLPSTLEGQRLVYCTDPPYYDNISYAELSDFYYVWLRHCLRRLFPKVFATVVIPKASELVAIQYRHGGAEEAFRFFESGMRKTLSTLKENVVDDIPISIFYAFKQEETTSEGTSSTGWDTFLTAVIEEGFQITSTLPIRTEGDNRQNSVGANALAASIVLVCRKRSSEAPGVSRAEFRRALRRELPVSLSALHKSNIAPVDMAQASIGPGMAIFSGYRQVIEADGSRMTVRSALQLINEMVGEIRGDDESALDAYTQFAVTWHESFGYKVGLFGAADMLAKARNVSVAGVEQAGILKSSAGKVRLYTRAELSMDWDPSTDDRLTVWEATQYLIKRLDEDGEGAAANLLRELAQMAEQARALAYRLYTTCERNGWAEEAQGYNGLILAWPELEKLAANAAADSDSHSQGGLFE